MSTLGDINRAECDRLASLADDSAGDAAAHVSGGVSLYIHVPFCASKCAYCDFFSLPLRPPASAHERWNIGDDGMFVDPVDEFLLAARMDGFLKDAVADVPTLYVGGGTPTVLGERLVELLEQTRGWATLRDDAEITIEANPDSVTPAVMRELAGAGVTRASLGVQSFDDAVLATLGRRHTAAAAAAAADAVLDAGMRLSVDLMCGVPGQSRASWQETLRRALTTGAGHASVYPLSVEPATPLSSAISRGRLPEPDPDAAAAMMLQAEDVLGGGGLRRYEVANYARPGEESRHNLRYWTGGEYAGVGPRAHSMMTPATLARVDVLGELTLGRLGIEASASGRVRFMANGASLKEFATQSWDKWPAEMEYLTPEEAAREDVMLGLRLTQGVDDALVERAGRPVREALERLCEQGLVEYVATGTERGEDACTASWRVTRRGWLLGNEVFSEVWTAE